MTLKLDKTGMTWEWNLFVETCSGHLRHVSRVDEKQKIFDVVANVGHRRNDQAVVLRTRKQYFS